MISNSSIQPFRANDKIADIFIITDKYNSKSICPFALDLPLWHRDQDSSVTLNRSVRVGFPS